MDKDTKRLLLVSGFAVTLWVGLSHLNVIVGALGKLWGLLLPITAGGVLAFFLNVPMTGLEHGLQCLTEKVRLRIPLRILRAISVLLTLAIIVLVLTLAGTLVIPELTNSVISLYEMILARAPTWLERLEQLDIDVSGLQEQLMTLDPNQLLSALSSRAGGWMDKAFSAAASAVGVVGNSLIALVLSIYFLASKRTLGQQCKRALFAYIPSAAADRIYRVALLVRNTFFRFLSGQCVEAIILGSLMFLSFHLFRLPYASLVGVFTAICAFIPYVGAFLSCFITALLILLIDPMQALISIIVYQVVQFVEGQFIYPRVVGSSIGLPPVWTLLASLIGGKLFGILGMIFFIPTAAVIYTLLRESVSARLKEQDISVP